MDRKSHFCVLQRPTEAHTLEFATHKLLCNKSLWYLIYSSVNAQYVPRAYTHSEQITIYTSMSTCCTASPLFDYIFMF